MSKKIRSTRDLGALRIGDGTKENRKRMTAEDEQYRTTEMRTLERN